MGVSITQTLINTGRQRGGQGLHHKDLKCRVQKELNGISKYKSSKFHEKDAFSTASFMLCDSCCLVMGDRGVRELMHDLQPLHMVAKLHSNKK